jgi:hypothetical protein
MSCQKALGICLGASTISAVLLSKEKKIISTQKTIVQPHNGNPKGVFSSIIDTLYKPGIPVLVTGRKFRHYVTIPSITEPQATEYALGFLQDGSLPYHALVSVGGETFLVYRLTPEHRIAGVSTGNKCASGTCEFFMQQIGRMGLDIEHAISAAEKGIPYRVSGRCTAFCLAACRRALQTQSLFRGPLLKAKQPYYRVLERISTWAGLESTAGSLISLSNLTVIHTPSFWRHVWKALYWKQSVLPVSGVRNVLLPDKHRSDRKEYS